MLDPTSQQLQQAQIRLVFEHLANGLRISALLSVILAIIVWPSIPTVIIICWLVMLWASLGIRWQHYRQFQALGKVKLEAKVWRLRLIASLFFTGLCWGLGASIFLFYIDSPVVVTVIVVCMFTLTLSAIPYQCHIPSAYRGYLCSIVIPMTLTLAYLVTDHYLEIIALNILYLWGMLYAAKLFRGFIESSQQLQWKTERLSQELAKSNQQLDEFFNNAPVEMYIKDLEGRYLRINRQFERLFGVKDRDARGKLPRDVHYSDLADSTQVHDLEVLNTGKTIHRHEIAILKSDNKPHELLTVKFPLVDSEGSIYGLGAVVTDITDEQAAKNKIEHLANFDALTNLPNRRLMLERLNQYLAYDRRTRGQGALLFLDLDHFKTINDSLGHSTGDLVLCHVAGRLLKNLRNEDTVARIGGDEFVILLTKVDGDAHLEHVYYTAEKLRKALAVPFHFPDQVLHITCSIGISLLPSGSNANADDLLKQADSAMYSAKNAGRNTCRFFSKDMQIEADARLKLHTELRSAFKNNELNLQYQPHHDAQGRIIGAEALLRWNHPQLGEIAPSVFIPMTEESGLILAIGDWVIREACEQLHHWGKDQTMASLPYLSINISPKQFHHPEFVPQLKQIITENGITPGRLALEMTEGVEIENLELATEKMRTLKALGLRIIIDDFGVGYSSLAYLKHLPLDAIKIDQSFIQDIHLDPNNAAIVEAIIALTHKMGIDVIAEGVETQQQLTTLEEMNCTLYQGFFFSPPLDKKSFVDFIATHAA